MKKNANRNRNRNYIYIYGIADLPHACEVSGEDTDMADGRRIYFFMLSQIRNMSNSGFGSHRLPTESRRSKPMVTDPPANVVNREVPYCGDMSRNNRLQSATPVIYRKVYESATQ